MTFQSNQKKRNWLSEDENEKRKQLNSKKSVVFDFNCVGAFKGKSYRFQLSHALKYHPYVILFFCGLALYDYFFFEEEDDILTFLYQRNYYDQFIKLGALPIAITTDQPKVQFAYITPGSVHDALEFQPSFISVSDDIQRTVSRAFKSIDLNTMETQRSVVVIDRSFQILFTYKVPDRKFFPMESVIHCFHPI
ncbi:hypothetical protein A0J61_10500 [Choanephora cucurbitarum]|uniref:Alkyl hydroperoxide reductase subunit C/ Thiol specific antioxidant domain-containing protein n=1 Tax=Choanephora cucurbitarum TaxID=101091 RepID=A0A1C7MXB3_9FUNG|nr:hypothetical protein A0J61_10500 [Choanephora cucurbitarum]